MLSINLDDVMQVLTNVRGYLIAFGVVLALAIVVMIAVRKLPKAKKKMIRTQSGVAILLALTIVVNLICTGPMSTMLDLVSGSGTISEETSAKATELVNEITADGVVLAKDEDNILPVASGSKLNVFGWASTNPCYGGTGSGALNTAYPVTDLLTGLHDAGIETNEELSKFYTDYKADRPSVGMVAQDWTLPEPNVSLYTDEMMENAKAFSDTAMVVITRVGGEGADLPSGENGTNDSWIKGQEGDGNYLALSAEEKELLQNLKTLKDNGTFKKIIVLINSSNAIEMDFLNPEICGEDYGIDSAMWIGDVGQTGINGVAQLLAGEVTPSGSLVDSYLYDNMANPAIYNFYTQAYPNAADYNLLTDGPDVQGMYSVYQEGIYLDYRYYETRYEDAVMGTGNAGDYNWSTTVAFPFGYGDSYTTFEYSDFNVTESADAFDVTLKVTNTGSTYSGKETVQLYFQSPYTDYDKANGIEKASAELCGFAKTDILAPGASETVNITVDKSELRTYDANNAKTYIVDAGDYYFTAATDAHNAVNNILAAKGYTVENTDGRMTADGNVALTYKWTNAALDSTTYATSENGTAITNLFDEADPNKSSSEPGEVTWLSRSNWVATFPTQPVVLNATQTLADHLAFTRYDGSKADSVEMPTLGADNGLALVSMIGADYDDPQWDTLLDQLTFNEMVNTITLGFHNTAAVESIGKTRTKDENGPQGLTAALTGGASAMCYTSEDVMAATFNVDLINDVGRCIGEDCLAMGYSGLYGPGINMHRTAYSGRNFEYYASDPFVAGTICAAEVNGIQSKGVYVYLKHVALNDSESSRRGVNTWLNEQAAREIYLEVADKAVTDGGAWSVMTGFNRWGAYWCGAYDNLLTGFLRGELGMRGMIITDYSGSSKYMDLADGLIAGSDIWDSPDPTIHTTLAPKYENDAYIVTEMRESMHKILYTVANSNAMNGWSSADRLKVITPWWKTALYALDTVLAVLTVLCIWRLVVAIKRKKTWTAEQAANTASAQNQQ